MVLTCWSTQVSKWLPNDDEWKSQLQKLQNEEQERILKFRFEIDRKRACLGRLLMRRVICQQLALENNEIKLSRTPMGKPYLLEPKHESFNFNISHHGDWVVAVASTTVLVGVDVMSYEYPRGSASIDDYFKTMNTCFTPEEWIQINDIKDDQQRLVQFYRFWSLKESYLKAIGEGMGFGLQRICFTIDSTKFPTYATLKVDGIDASDWQFYVSELDTNHCVSVATQQCAQKLQTIQWENIIHFS